MVGHITATLTTRCTQGGPRFQIDVPMVGFIFKSQTSGLETWMASIPWTSVSFLYYFVPSLAQPVAGYIQIRKYRNNCRGNEQMLCFIFEF